MGAEQSNQNSRKAQASAPQISEEQVWRLLEDQRREYERKVEELAAKAAAEKNKAEAALKKQEQEAARAAAQRTQQEEAARNSAYSIERDRTPYSYVGNQLQQCAATAPPPPHFNNVYPNLGAPGSNFGPSGSNCGPSGPSCGPSGPSCGPSGPSCGPSGPSCGPFGPNRGPFGPNRGPSGPNFGPSGLNNGQNNMCNNNNSPFRPTNPNQEYVFVNNHGPSASYNRPAPRPAPSAPPQPRRSAPRTRSESRNRNSARERDVYDCPTCNQRYGVKIFQCENGHSSCNDCMMRGRACGICRRNLTNVRNFDLEDHIAQTKALCPHASEGCKLYIKVANMEEHVKECPFKEQNCPLTAVFGTCRWKGKLSQISSHFESSHPSGCVANVDSEMQLTNVRNNSQQVNLIVLGTYNFLLHVKVSEADGKLYMAVQLIGTKTSANKWLYEVHIYNKNENRRKFMYTDNCSASIDKIEDVFKTGECAVLPIWHAYTFVNNGALNYKIFIKQVNAEKKGKNQRGKGKN